MGSRQNGSLFLVAPKALLWASQFSRYHSAKPIANLETRDCDYHNIIQLRKYFIQPSRKPPNEPSANYICNRVFAEQTPVIYYIVGTLQVILDKKKMIIYFDGNINSPELPKKKRRITTNSPNVIQLQSSATCNKSSSLPHTIVPFLKNSL